MFVFVSTIIRSADSVVAPRAEETANIRASNATTMANKIVVSNFRYTLASICVFLTFMAVVFCGENRVILLFCPTKLTMHTVFL